MLRQKTTYFFNVSYPIPDVFERLFIGDVIHQHNSLRLQMDKSFAQQTVIQIS
jgi:hypothetical protein